VKRTTLASSAVLAAFLAAVAAAALSGVFFPPGAWYEALEKPALTPPNWIFAPVWSALYVCIAVAGWLVWQSGQRGLPIGLWVAQLLLNAAWSWLFFGLHLPGVAFAEIVLLWATIVSTIAVFSRIRALAAGLMLPYLAWVSLAAWLNWGLWQLNQR
jgi:tryptophan-rich sensory protein